MILITKERLDKYLFYTGLVTISLIVVSYFLYSATVAYDIPQIDHIRWLRRYLIAYTQHEIGLFDYLTSEFYPFSHSHILTLLFTLFNYKYFSLRYDFDCYLGIIFTALLFMFLMKKYYDTSNASISHRHLIITSTALTAIFLNPHNIGLTSLVQFEYIYLLLAVVYLSVYDQVLKNNIKPIIFYIFTFTLFFIGDAMGIVSILTVLTHALLVQPRKNINNIAGIIVALLSGYFLASYFIIDMEPHGYSKSGALAYISSHMVDSFKIILNGYSQGLVDITTAQKLYPNNWAVILYTTGLLLLAFNISAFYLYLRRRNNITSSLPGLLIIFSAITIIGILLTRLPTLGPSVALNYRFQRLFVIGFFGSYWIYALVFFESIKTKPGMYKYGHVIGRSILGVFTIAILLNSIISSIDRWKSSDGHLNTLDRMAGAMIAYSANPKVDMAKYYRRVCANDLCNAPIHFLKQKRLSIFRSSHIIQRGHRTVMKYDETLNP